MELRTLHENEYEAWLELLDRWELADGLRGREFFRKPIDHDPSFSADDVWVAVEGEELRATVQIFPRSIQLLGHAVPTGGVGSVYTAPEHRRAGLALQLLERATEDMRARGAELSLLFAGVPALYAQLGWQSWPCARALLRPGPARLDLQPPAGVSFARFERDRDLSVVSALHRSYSAMRSGTVVRDAAAWHASLALAGNPAEEFIVARRGEDVVAYARFAILNGMLVATELGRSAAAAESLAALVCSAFEARDPEPLAPDGGSPDALRSNVVLPTFDDLPLTVALERRGLECHPLEDPTPMFRCLDAPALARRLGADLAPGEGDAAFLARVFPADRFVSWPADRF